MNYDFINGLGGYSYQALQDEVKKFDGGDLINRYNQTYINARQSIDWHTLSVDIDKKIQFLIDWKTDYVRINRRSYPEKMIELSGKESLKETLARYKDIELQKIDLSSTNISSDIKYIYQVFDDILKPTTASKILHMFNPNLFPIWDMRMRENLFRTRAHKPIQYLNVMLLMQKEFNIILKNTMREFSISKISAIEKIKKLDEPTYSILRIMDKVNYNNSRLKRVKSISKNHTNYIKKGEVTMITKSSGKENTGLRLSDFLKNHLPHISSFSMNKPGGFTFAEEQQLWREGKMTASFLKQVGKMLQFQTYQVSNYDLLNSLKDNKEKLMKVLRERPELDKSIVIKSKAKGGSSGSGTLKSGLLS